MWHGYSNDSSNNGISIVLVTRIMVMIRTMKNYANDTNDSKIYCNHDNCSTTIRTDNKIDMIVLMIIIANVIVYRINICNTLLAKLFADVTIMNRNLTNNNVGI